MNPSDEHRRPPAGTDVPRGPVDCNELFDKLDLFLDRELPQRELDRLETHLAHCLPCTGRRDFEEQLRAVVRDRCADQAPPELVERIRDHLQLPVD